MKIHMAFKGGLVKYPRSSTQGGGGVKNTQKSIHMVYGCSPSMEPCIVRILQSVENFAFWTLWRTIQGPTVLHNITE